MGGGMSYLELAKQAEARLRGERYSYAIDAVDAENGTNRAQPKRFGDGPENPGNGTINSKGETNRVNGVNRVGGDAQAVVEALPFLAMSLDDFATRGAALEISVTWLDVTLWLVPGERDAQALVLDGVARGRIWTSHELGDLMTVADRTPERVKVITHAKVEMDGDLVTIRWSTPRATSAGSDDRKS